MKSQVMNYSSMTRSLHTDPTNAALMQAENPLLVCGPDNKFADRIIDFRSGDAQRERIRNSIQLQHVECD
jgi:hypothetical protein